MAKKINAGTQEEIVNHIRNGILSGMYKPSQVIEQRTYFIEKYNTTPITVQRAFNYLIKNSFVETKARLGTFVAERPSNLFRYALVFARDRQHADWTRFWQLMIANKSIIEEELNIDIKIYEGLEYEKKSKDYFRFLQDKKAGAFAGVMVASELNNFDGELFGDLTVPCVAISSLREFKHIPNLKIDKKSFHNQLAEKAAELGSKRISVLSSENYTINREEHMCQCFEKNKLDYDEDFVQSFSVKEPFWTERYVSLMMRMSKQVQPDCFMIIDDNFLPYVFNQLIKSGKIPGEDINVISHANFPIDYEKYPGVNFVGYDVIDILRQGILTLKLDMSKNKEIIIESVTR